MSDYDDMRELGEQLFSIGDTVRDLRDDGASLDTEPVTLVESDEVTLNPTKPALEARAGRMFRQLHAMLVKGATDSFAWLSQDVHAEVEAMVADHPQGQVSRFEMVRHDGEAISLKEDGGRYTGTVKFEYRILDPRGSEVREVAERWTLVTVSPKTESECPSCHVIITDRTCPYCYRSDPYRAGWVLEAVDGPAIGGVLREQTRAEAVEPPDVKRIEAVQVPDLPDLRMAADEWVPREFMVTLTRMRRGRPVATRIDFDKDVPRDSIVETLRRRLRSQRTEGWLADESAASAWSQFVFMASAYECLVAAERSKDLTLAARVLHPAFYERLSGPIEAGSIKSFRAGPGTQLAGIDLSGEANGRVVDANVIYARRVQEQGSGLEGWSMRGERWQLRWAEKLPEATRICLTCGAEVEGVTAECPYCQRPTPPKEALLVRSIRDIRPAEFGSITSDGMSIG